LWIRSVNKVSVVSRLASGVSHVRGIMATYKVTLLRHGESAWNAEPVNKFCGWYDADLAESGFAEAKKAAQVC